MVKARLHGVYGGDRSCQDKHFYVKWWW